MSDVYPLNFAKRWFIMRSVVAACNGAHPATSGDGVWNSRHRQAVNLGSVR